MAMTREEKHNINHISTIQEFCHILSISIMLVKARIWLSTKSLDSEDHGKGVKVSMFITPTKNWYFEDNNSFYHKEADINIRILVSPIILHFIVTLRKLIS